ncbi:hypothetical protein ACSBR1_026493 [Camellia fascicularis]
MEEENTKLQEKLNEQRRAISEVEGEIKALQSNLTLDQILVNLVLHFSSTI